MAGWLFVAYGAFMVVGGVISPTGSWIIWGIAVFVPVLLVAVLGYSYWVWKNDPDK
jgi:hypothetical protein